MINLIPDNEEDDRRWQECRDGERNFNVVGRLVDAHNENVNSVRCIVLMASLVFQISKLTMITFRPP